MGLHYKNIIVMCHLAFHNYFDLSHIASVLHIKSYNERDFSTERDIFLGKWLGRQLAYK